MALADDCLDSRDVDGLRSACCISVPEDLELKTADLARARPYNVCHMPLNPLARFMQPKPPMLITGSAELESLCRKVFRA